MNRQEFLAAVSEAILKGRNVNYGEPEDNFRATAGIWNAYLGDRMVPGLAIGPADVAALMIGLKLARMRTSPGKADHWVDLGGYAGCGVECATKHESAVPNEDEYR